MNLKLKPSNFHNTPPDCGGYLAEIASFNDTSDAGLMTGGGNGHQEAP
jgi:hypothetical protein